MTFIMICLMHFLWLAPFLERSSPFVRISSAVFSHYLVIFQIGKVMFQFKTSDECSLKLSSKCSFHSHKKRSSKLFHIPKLRTNI